MKYLTFKQFTESLDHFQVEEILDTCEDILLELRDDGLKSWVKLNHSCDRFIVEIMAAQEFKYEFIKPIIERLENYLLQFGIKPSTRFGNRSGWTTIFADTYHFIEEYVIY